MVLFIKLLHSDNGYLLIVNSNGSWHHYFALFDVLCLFVFLKLFIQKFILGKDNWIGVMEKL